MNVNFEIINNSEIKFNNNLLDLHNNYDLILFEYDFLSNSLILKFKLSKGDWIKEDELKSFALIHENVNYLLSSDLNNGKLVTDRDCICLIGYFESSNRETNDCFNLNSFPNDNEDIIYLMESELFLRINCSEIIFKENA